MELKQRDRFLPRGDKSGSPTDLKLENLPDVVIGFCPEQGDRRAHFEIGTLENPTPPCLIICLLYLYEDRETQNPLKASSLLRLFSPRSKIVPSRMITDYNPDWLRLKAGT